MAQVNKALGTDKKGRTRHGQTLKVESSLAKAIRFANNQNCDTVIS